MRYLPYAQRPELPAADRVVTVVPCDEQINCITYDMSPARVMSWTITAAGNVYPLVFNPDSNCAEIIHAGPDPHPRYESRPVTTRATTGRVPTRQHRPSPNGRRLLNGAST